jgi:hypothetical protein
MDHEQIDQLGLIDRYVMGRLLADESASFEEHFVDCPQCIARLQTTKDFLQDFRRLTAAQAAQREPRQKAAGWPLILQALLRRPVALAAGGLLIAVIANAVFVIYYTRGMRAAVNQTQRLAEQWEGRYEDERQRAIAADQRHQEAESQQAEQRRALEAKLKDEEAQHAKEAADLGRRLPVGGNLAIFVLTSLRGREPVAAEPTKRIAVPRATALFALSIGLEGERHYALYRGTIYDEHDRPVWSGQLIPGQSDTLSAWLNPAAFRPGHYSLIVEGVTKAGEAETVGNYPFQFTRAL